MSLQALRHVGPSSTDSSPRLLHSLSLPSGHCSMPFGPDDMAFVGSGLGAAACPPSGAALLSSAGSWPDLDMPTCFLPRPVPEMPNNPAIPGQFMSLNSSSACAALIAAWGTYGVCSMACHGPRHLCNMRVSIAC